MISEYQKIYLEKISDGSFYKDNKYDYGGIPKEISLQIIEWAYENNYTSGIDIFSTFQGKKIVMKDYELTLEGYLFLENLNKSKEAFEPTKIEIVNFEDNAKSFGINQTVIDKMLEHQKEIIEIYKELNFITLDSLVVAKEHLEKLKKEKPEFPVDRIINCLGALGSLLSGLK